MVKRCRWAEDSSENMQAYHDTEWGKPEHNEQKLFELLCLETYQAGLSWQTVLNKRARYREVFHQYDIDQVAAMDETDYDRLMQDPGIIRNKLKIRATMNNAKRIQHLHEAGQTFDNWLWAFVDNTPIRHYLETMAEMPAQDDLSKSVSKQMKKLGFSFVGPTTIYSFLQAGGLINDHVKGCDFSGDNW